MRPLTPIEGSVSKTSLYQHICEQMNDLLGSETDLVANAANTAALLFLAVPDINWVGFYIAQGEELVLGPFQGKPACSRIPFGKGVCGTAAREQDTIVVPDVNAYPGHIVCDVESRSEIAVPLLNWGKLVGVLDVDSATPNRFDDDDREGFESIVSVFLATVAMDDLPDLSEASARSN